MQLKSTAKKFYVDYGIYYFSLVLPKICPVQQRRVAKWHSPFVMPRRRRLPWRTLLHTTRGREIHSAAAKEGNDVRTRRRTFGHVYVIWKAESGRGPPSEMRERPLWYIITIFVMLWRGIRFPLRDGKKEGGGSGSERTEGERRKNRRVPPIDRA